MTLLFLHGFGTNGKVWENQINFFSKNHQVLAPDLDLSNLDTEAQRIINLCLKGNLQDMVLIAWSMGTFLGLKIYFHLPEKIKALILVGATPKFVKDETFPCGLSLLLVRSLEKKLKRNFLEGMNFFYDLMFSQKRPKEIGGFDPPEYEAAIKSLEELKASDARDLLPKISVPTLILHGEKDQICPVSAANYMRRRISNSRLVVFENEGHAPFISNPEKFNQTINPQTCCGNQKRSNCSPNRSS